MDTNICQSCGMPLADEKIVGTEKDGVLNPEYCIYCYEDGAFTEPNITMEEMADVCVHYMTTAEHGFDEASARKLMDELLPNLKRWK